MFQNLSFRFRTNISIDAYQSKTDAIACLSKKGAVAIGKEKMAFKEQNVNTKEFIYYATNGHAFCNLFEYAPNEEYWFQTSQGTWHKSFPEYKKGANKGGMKLCMKADKFFKGSQTVFVDVDYTRFDDVGMYISTLTYEPTCVYMSFSDRRDKGGKVSRRFRMVYVFDRMLNKEELIHISQTINDQIVFDTAEPMDDDCGTRISQYMNGVYDNNEYYASGKIYDVSDFPEELPDPICTTSDLPAIQQQQGIVFDERMLADMEGYSYEDFMHFYSWRFKYRYRVEKPDWRGVKYQYQLTDEDYLQLWWYREKQMDGQRRRRKLYKNACLRRLMFPDMSPDEALFNLYVDLVRFFDNSDGAITLQTLVRKVKHAFEKTEEQLRAFCDFEINYWHTHRKTYIVKPGNKMNWGVNKSIQKEINWSQLDMVYDKTISVQENIQRGINVSETTLYRYCHERGIDTNPQKGVTEMQRRENRRNEKAERIKQFQQLYDRNLTIRENQSNLASHGLKLSRSTLQNWSKWYINGDESVYEPIDLSFITVPNFQFNIGSLEVPVPKPAPTCKEEKEMN